VLGLKDPGLVGSHGEDILDALERVAEVADLCRQEPDNCIPGWVDSGCLAPSEERCGPAPGSGDPESDLVGESA